MAAAKAYRNYIYEYYAKINSGELGIAFAGSCFYALPVLLVLLYGQEYLKNGIAITGLKG